MAPGVALAAVIYIGLNEARYHTVWDVGLNYIPNVHPTPLFGFKYFWTNLKTLLWWPPKFDSVFPYMHPHWLAQGLLWTSPAFILAFRRVNYGSYDTDRGDYANLDNRDHRAVGNFLACGACALLVAAPMLLVWANGFAQFGCRHFVPMFPFLLVMMAQRPLGRVGKGLIVLSIFLVTFGIVHIHLWGMSFPW